MNSGKARCYIETSALKYYGVEEAFYNIAKFSHLHQKNAKSERNTMRHSAINMN